MIMRALAFAAVACALGPAPSHAGQCADDIYRANVEIGKRLDALAAAGKTGTQSSFATMHRQPTPATIAGAEEKIGDISDAELNAVHEWMAKAKQADESGDTAGCENALTQARTLLGM